MHTEQPTPRDKLSPEHVTSPRRKRSRTTFGTLANDLEEDEIGGKGRQEFDVISTQGSIEKETRPNLHHVLIAFKLNLLY
jgi:hypothetical protein